VDFVKLFEPITINRLIVPNRIVMPAMGLAFTDDYSLNERYKAFYRERAHGGVGLMIIGPMAIDTIGAAPFMPGLFDERNVESIEGFVQELHRDTETMLGTQLFHMGRSAFSMFSGQTPIGPSAIPSPLTRETPREMTKDDIEEVKDSFAGAARRAKEAGFDFVEIIACTGYLISQFLSPVTNKRSDEYGGSLENRMRFGLEVIRSVRQAVGDDFAIGIRIAGHDFIKGGNTNKESALFAATAQQAGVDAINVTGGWHETKIPQLTTDVPPGAYVYLARGIKRSVSIPVFASNRLGDPVVAEKTLRSSASDMICWGRPLIADPELPRKVKEGRLNEIVPCIACNQGCFDSIFSGTSVCCVMNPRAGREGELSITKAAGRKKILVAGGGPAGMEFAATAAMRGHEVSLFEQTDDLGGQVNLAKAPPRKMELQNIIESLRGRMDVAGVNINLNASVEPEQIDSLVTHKFDVLVVASGAKPLDIRVPGIDRPHVISAWDVLRNKVYDIGDNVVIVGGSATGCETAHFIAAMGTPGPEAFTHIMYHRAEDPEYAMGLLHDSGRTITVIEMVDRMADNVGRTARWSLLKSLRLMGVKLRTNTKLAEITDGAVVVETSDGTETIPADTVVIAVGARSEDRLSMRCNGNNLAVIRIGDAKQPRKITDAIREGFEEALKV